MSYFNWQAAYGRREEFFLFASVMEATMIDKRMSEKSIQFELSMGNAGNTLDGQIASAAASAAAGEEGDDASSESKHIAGEF